MTLKPRVVNPITLQRGFKPNTKPAQKMMVIDCKNPQQWNAIHDSSINGVVLRRRPIRAIETFLTESLPETLEPFSFQATHSICRKKIEEYFNSFNKSEGLGAKFMINDILNFSRILINQSHSRDYLYKINPPLNDQFESSPNSLKMFLTYRNIELSFRQINDSDVRSFSPYGAALFRGTSYMPSVEYKANILADACFYMTIEPYNKRVPV